MEVFANRAAPTPNVSARPGSFQALIQLVLTRGRYANRWLIVSLLRGRAIDASVAASYVSSGSPFTGLFRNVLQRRA